MMKETGNIIISEESPHTPNAVMLMDELSNALEAITGSSGRASFDIDDLKDERSVFTVARDICGNALGCGSLRPLDTNTAEIKRMYARVQGVGVGSRILRFLEYKASELGYARIVLETRLANTVAVAFYEVKGYSRIPNYGRYEGNLEAACFEKVLF